LVSSLTHASQGDQVTIPTQALNDPNYRQQYEEEQKNPMLASLLELLPSRELVICQEAFNRFIGILNIVGGTTERLRTVWLFRNQPPNVAGILDRSGNPLTLANVPVPIPCTRPEFHRLSISVIPDTSYELLSRLFEEGKVKLKPFHITIFGSGISRKMTNLTANVTAANAIQKWIRSASFWTHKPRILTEGKGEVKMDRDMSI